jgi:antitoxin component YwqK of YwqJK toxin-antitoxin module
MKRILAPILLVVLLFPTLALGEEVTMDDLVKTDGVYHKPFNQIPFTGNVTGVYQGHLKNGKKHGPWSDFWDEGRIANTRTYKDGILVGHTIYRKNGTVEVRKNYSLGASGVELDGPYEDYHSNGQLSSKGTYKNGKKDGSWVWYYDNGQLQLKETFKDGKEDGSWVSHYKNGQLRSKKTYKNGKRDGHWVRYYDNGQLYSKETYKDGKEDGSWVYYHEHGQLDWKGDFKDGKKEGSWVNYYDNGQLDYKGTYKNSKRHGPWESYDKNGQLDEKYTGTYKNGVKVD